MKLLGKMLLVSALWSAYCLSDVHLPSLSNYSFSTNDDHIVIKAQLFTKQEATNYFKKELVNTRCITVSIKNNSQHTYHIYKRNVSLPQVSTKKFVSQFMPCYYKQLLYISGIFCYSSSYAGYAALLASIARYLVQNTLQKRFYSVLLRKKAPLLILPQSETHFLICADSHELSLQFDISLQHVITQELSTFFIDLSYFPANSKIIPIPGLTLAI